MAAENKPNINTSSPNPAPKQPASAIRFIPPAPLESAASHVPAKEKPDAAASESAPAPHPAPAEKKSALSDCPASNVKTEPAEKLVINTPPNKPEVAILQDALSLTEEQALLDADYPAGRTELGTAISPALAEQKPISDSPEAPKKDNEQPHQPNDIKPEEIVEHEQEPPEKIVTADDKNIVNDKLKTIIKGKKEEDLKHHPSPAEEAVYRERHRELKQKIKQVKEMPLEPSTPPAMCPATAPFTVRYLQKLTEQLKAANAKRQKQAEANLRKIMDYARQTQKVTNDDVEKITGVKDRQALRYLKKLTKQGKLIRFGNKKNIFYKPI